MAQAVSLLYLEDYQIGKQSRSITQTIPKEEIIRFASDWDPQPWHIDEEQAKNSIYGGITACTAHIFSIVCRLGANTEPKPAALAGLGFDNMQVHQPLRAGDTVYYVEECIGVRRSRSKPDRGIVKSRTSLFNQNDELIFTLDCSMMVWARQAADC